MRSGYFTSLNFSGETGNIFKRKKGHKAFQSGYFIITERNLSLLNCRRLHGDILIIAIAAPQPIRHSDICHIFALNSAPKSLPVTYCAV